MATATISKGKNAPEGDLTITPAYGDQFTVGSDSYTADDPAQVAGVSELIASGVLDVAYTDEDSKEDAAAVKEAEKAARQRHRDILADKPSLDLTPVPDTAQGDPDPNATDLTGDDS